MGRRLRNRPLRARDRAEHADVMGAAQPGPLLGTAEWGSPGERSRSRVVPQPSGFADTLCRGPGAGRTVPSEGEATGRRVLRGRGRETARPFPGRPGMDRTSPGSGEGPAAADPHAADQGKRGRLFPGAGGKRPHLYNARLGGSSLRQGAGVPDQRMHLLDSGEAALHVTARGRRVDWTPFQRPGAGSAPPPGPAPRPSAARMSGFSGPLRRSRYGGMELGPPTERTAPEVPPPSINLAEPHLHPSHVV